MSICEHCGKPITDPADMVESKNGNAHGACQDDYEVFGAEDDDGYSASGQYVRTSWGWGEDFGADR